LLGKLSIGTLRHPILGWSRLRMAVLKTPTPAAAQRASDIRPLTDHAHSIMVLAANGARRLALQEEVIRAMTQAGQVSRLAAAREQLRLMYQAQQIRMQLLSTAQREIIRAALGTETALSDVAAPPLMKT
jgi:hypothetical protein